MGLVNRERGVAGNPPSRGGGLHTRLTYLVENVEFVALYNLGRGIVLVVVGLVVLVPLVTLTERENAVFNSVQRAVNTTVTAVTSDNSSDNNSDNTDE